MQIQVSTSGMAHPKVNPYRLYYPCSEGLLTGSVALKNEQLVASDASHGCGYIISLPLILGNIPGFIMKSVVSIGTTKLTSLSQVSQKSMSVKQ